MKSDTKWLLLLLGVVYLHKRDADKMADAASAAERREKEAR